MKTVRKIILLLFVMLCIGANTITKAANVLNDYIEIYENTEFEYTIDFGENIVSTDVELSYDTDKIELIGAVTQNTEYNEIEKGKLIVLYVDETGAGASKVTLKFKSKTIKSKRERIKIIAQDINAYSLEKDGQYTKTELGIASLEKTIDIIKEEPSNTPDTSRNETIVIETDGTKSEALPSKLPATGNKVKILMIIGIIILTIVAIILGVKGKKFLSIIVIGFIFVGAANVDAYQDMLIKKYNAIINYNNLVVALPNKTLRNVTKEEFKEKASSVIEIEDIVDEENQSIKDNELVATEDKIITKDGKEFTLLVYGDINSDGKVNSIDIGLIIKEEVNNVAINGIRRKAANLVNGNDETDILIDHKDVNRFKEYILRTTNVQIVDVLPKELEEEENKIVGIRIYPAPNKLTYIEGEELDLTGGKLVVTYEDGTTKVIDLDSDEVTVVGYDPTEIGDQTLTIIYEDKETSFDVTVIENKLVFEDKTVTEAYSESSQTVEIDEASEGTGEYVYTEKSETNQDGTNTNYISILGATITVAEGTPAGTYTYVITAKDLNTGITKDAVYTIIIEKLQATTSVIIEGTNTCGETLTANVTTNGDGEITYQWWYSDVDGATRGIAINGATDRTYVPTKGLVGKYIG